MISARSDRPTFLIDSDDRLNKETTTNENFSYEINLSPHAVYDTVCLVHAGIPKSYYNCNSDTNTFTLIENGVSETVTLEIGNYNKTNFITKVKAALEKTSALISPTHPWTYTITYDDFTGKFIYDITHHASRTFTSASFYFPGDRAHELTGFFEGSTNAFVTPSSSPPTAQLISTVPADFELTKYITIKSSIARNNGSLEKDTSSIVRIPVRNTAFNDIITYDLQELQEGAKEFNHNENKSNIFNFSIYDDHNRLLQLNGRDWFLTLFIYEHNPLTNIQLRELKVIRDKRFREEEIRKEAANPNYESKITQPHITSSVVQGIPIEREPL